MALSWYILAYHIGIILKKVFKDVNPIIILFYALIVLNVKSSISYLGFLFVMH